MASTFIIIVIVHVHKYTITFILREERVIGKIVSFTVLVTDKVKGQIITVCHSIDSSSRGYIGIPDILKGGVTVYKYYDSLPAL